MERDKDVFLPLEGGFTVVVHPDQHVCCVGRRCTTCRECMGLCEWPHARTRTDAVSSRRLKRPYESEDDDIVSFDE